MITTIIFTFIAGGLILLAGHKDQARDPRLTLFLLVLIALLPLFSMILPKVELLAADETSYSENVFPIVTSLFAVWVMGCLLFLSRLAMASIGLHRWRKSSNKFDVIDGVEIYAVRNLRGPVAAGVVQKMIFVPENWNSWSADDQKIVLDHELSHHRRKDPLWRLCAEIARAIHWYNPLVHWMVNRFTLQCEYACDESVLELGANPKSYARLLCSIAEKQANAPLAPAMANPSSLQLRVSRMLTSSKRSSTVLLILLASLATATAGALAIIGNKAPTISQQEIETRLNANPFPGEP